MAIELIPSILATTKKELQERSTLAQKLASTVHLDVMDGLFVPTTSVGVENFSTIRWKSRVEVHAMVQQLGLLVSLLDQMKPVLVYLHVELGSALLPLIDLLRSRRVDCGLAINPTTPIQKLRPYIHFASTILVLAVPPGHYRAVYWPGTIRRIQAIHRRWPHLFIACDGGMNTRTIPAVIRAGAKRIIVGSDAMLRRAPLKHWHELQRLTRQ